MQNMRCCSSEILLQVRPSHKVKPQRSQTAQSGEPISSQTEYLIVDRVPHVLNVRLLDGSTAWDPFHCACSNPLIFDSQIIAFFCTIIAGSRVPNEPPSRATRGKGSEPLSKRFHTD